MLSLIEPSPGRFSTTERRHGEQRPNHQQQVQATAHDEAAQRGSPRLTRNRYRSSRSNSMIAIRKSVAS